MAIGAGLAGLLFFPSIGGAISIGMVIEDLYTNREIGLGRRVSMLLMVPVFLGFIGVYNRENLQMEQMVFYLHAGIFTKVVIHYAIAKLFGPLFARLKIGSSGEDCIECQKCDTNCPMDVSIKEYILSGQRVRSTECILCGTCETVCPTKAVKI
ncbi:MAG: 4Fe-4S dicluster domain-containing protein [bacterium]